MKGGREGKGRGKEESLLVHASGKSCIVVVLATVEHAAAVMVLLWSSCCDGATMEQLL